MTTRRRRAVAFGCIALAGALAATQAHAQGSFPVSKLGDPALPHAQAVQTAGEPGSIGSITTREKAAASLYADATAYANLAEWEAAQRILEVIVRQYPDTETAVVARADMQKIIDRLVVQGHRFSLGSTPDDGAPNPELAVPLDEKASSWAPIIRQ